MPLIEHIFTKWSKNADVFVRVDPGDAMILTGQAIKSAVRDGDITIQPFSEDLLNPNSYNYRIGDIILEFDNAVIDPKKRQEPKKIHIPVTGFVLQPNRLYLAATYERIGSSVYVPSLIGRSSLARLGLFLQITANLGHLGAEHCWTLELTCVQPLKIYPHMRIGQVSFWRPEGAGLPEVNYAAITESYNMFSVPHASNPYKFE